MTTSARSWPYAYNLFAGIVKNTFACFRSHRRELFQATKQLRWIDDLAAKAAGDGPVAIATQGRLIELNTDARFARTLIATKNIRLTRSPCLALNRLHDAAKIAWARESVRLSYATRAEVWKILKNSGTTTTTAGRQSCSVDWKEGQWARGART
jgi:hypothetical protein